MTTRRDVNKLLGAAALGSVLGALPFGAGSAFAQSGAALERVRSSGRLRIGAVADAAPFYAKDLVSGEWRGIYVDISKALADELSVELAVTETTWGNSILDLQTGKLDIFVGLNPTPERQQVIDFSVPVFKNAFSLLVREGTEGQTWEDFNRPDFRVAVDIGSAQDASVTRNLPNATVTRLRTPSDATAALQAGRVDAQCLTVVLAMRTRKVNPALGVVVVPSPIDATSSHAGFRRDEDASWREFVDRWIEQKREEGFVRETVIRNMELVGLSENDIPEGAALF